MVIVNFCFMYVPAFFDFILAKPTKIIYNIIAEQKLFTLYYNTNLNNIKYYFVKKHIFLQKFFGFFTKFSVFLGTIMKKETKKEKKERAAKIVSVLKEVYPASECALEYEGEPWKLLVMGRLSAQCTDARVNIVCRELFAKYPTAHSLADGELSEIENIVRPCGLFRTKAESIKQACVMLCDVYGGVLPNTMEELLLFPGVGRKIANLLLGDIYHVPAIVADTHCIRICGRLGFYHEELKDPHKVELIMRDFIEPDEQSDFCHRIVMFGREYCMARSPRCAECPLSSLCPKKG